jgi:diguanylate cyclase (GGDEF)-like protein/PAS domain S-box-containing protein
VRKRLLDSPILVVLILCIILLLVTYLLLDWNLPDTFLLLFSIPAVLISFFYRRIYYLLLVFVTSIAAVPVSIQSGESIFESIIRVGVAALTIIGIAELIQYTIRQRQQAEEALLRSHQQYRDLLANINDVAFLVDLEGRFTYISPAIEHISGYKVDNLLGKRFAEFIHPDDLSFVEESFLQTLQGNGSLKQFRVLDIDGNYKHVRTFSRKVIENEKLTAVSGIMVDVTAFIQNEADLHARQRQLTLLSDITRTALASLDLNTMYQKLANQLGDLFNADGCSITLWDSRQNRVIPVAANSASHTHDANTTLISSEISMTESVLKAGKPLFADDVYKSPYINAFFSADLPTCSMLGLPLIAGGKWLGAALVAYNDPRQFLQSDLDWSSVVADQVALAINKGQALEAERQQRMVGDALREAGITLTETLHFDEVLDRLLPQIKRILPFDCGVLMLVTGKEAHMARAIGYEQVYSPEVLQNVLDQIFDIDKTENIRQVIQTRGPVIIPDVKEFSDWVPVEGVTNLRSWAGVPIMAKGEVLAIYSLEKIEPNFYQEEHIQILTAFAAQAALALQNAQLYAKAQRQMEAARTLRQASSAVVSELDQEKVLYQILDQLNTVIPYDSASVFIAEKNCLHIVAVRGFDHPETVLGLQVERDNPLFAEITRTKKPIILRDAQQDERFRGWANTSHVRGWMGVPLIARGEIIGELTIDSHKVGAYTDSDAELVMDFATETSIAIQHAELYRKALDTANRLSILHQASQQVSATLDPYQLYEAVHLAATQVMPTESFVISMLVPDTQEIELVYMMDRYGRSPIHRVPAGRGLSGYVIRTGRTVLIGNLETELDFEVIPFGDPNPVQSFLAVPMRRQDGSVFGMVSAQSYQKYAYRPEDVELLELLAAHAAISLDNTRLFSELQHQAILDDLTGLYNRRHFFEVARLEFERARRYQRSLSIIMVDIDHFKHVNDRYGHLVGDQVLRLIADRFRLNVREIDVAGRYGGEEFILLIPETGSEGVRQAAERLRIAISNTPVQTFQHSISITASIGVASIDSNCPDLDHLIYLADKSLYLAKKAGRNLVGIQTAKPTQIDD